MTADPAVSLAASALDIAVQDAHYHLVNRHDCPGARLGEDLAVARGSVAVPAVIE
jgi:hypothetical protein